MVTISQYCNYVYGKKEAQNSCFALYLQEVLKNHSYTEWEIRIQGKSRCAPREVTNRILQNRISSLNSVVHPGAEKK